MGEIFSSRRLRLRDRLKSTIVILWRESRCLRETQREVQLARIKERLTRPNPAWFTLHPVATREHVEAFEREHGDTLPLDYRDFTLQIGDGCTNRINSFNNFDALFERSDYASRFDPRDAETYGPALAPFPFLWDDGWLITFGCDQDENLEPIPRFADYPHHGLARSLYCWGCDVYDYLVLTGPEKGTLWKVLTEREGSAKPLVLATGERATFLDWFKFSFLPRRVLGTVGR